MLVGLVSITFRELSPPEIIKMVSDAQLDCIEWGADIHCPPGDLDNAGNVARLMDDNGLITISYGTYFHVVGKKNNNSFDDIVETALALKTDNIRVWTGDISSKDADGEYWSRAVEETRRIADLAAQNKISISFEYHHTTLSDCLDSTIRLLQDVDRENVFTYWQPQAYSEPNTNIWDISQLVKIKKLKNLHVFSWEGWDKLPLEARSDNWISYIKAASVCNPAILLEFVKEPAQFYLDAKHLISLRERG